MKKLFSPLNIIFLILLISTVINAQKEPVGKITFYVGRVFVIPAGTSDLTFAQFNKDLFPGDKIETKKESRCEITLKSGDVLRIDANSLFTIERIEVTENSVKTESSIGLGKIWANIKKIFSEDSYFKVKSPSAVIAVRGTIYRVDANEDTTTQVVVYDGEVAVSPAAPGMEWGDLPPQPGMQKPQEVAPPQQVAPPTEVSVETWMEIVKAQQQIMVKPDGSYTRSDYDPEEDAKLDWVQWNRKRDMLLGR